MLGVPAVWGLKFSMAQKKLQKVPVRGSASWGKGQLGDKNLTLGRTIYFGVTAVDGLKFSMK